MIDFVAGVAEKICCYVYLLIDPRDDAVFYVGKGTGNRCFAHLTEACKTKADSIGDYPKLALIRDIESAGRTVQIVILRHGLTEHQSLLIEASIIDLLTVFAKRKLTNRVDGHNTAERGWMSVADINALYGAVPVTIDPKHRVALIRINRLFEPGMTENELYEATRKWWKVSSIRRQKGGAYAPEWAMSVYGGVVRAVYRIEDWEKPPEEDFVNHPERETRWVFRGTRDPRMEELYLNRDVSSHLRKSETSPYSQTPLRYINCEGGKSGRSIISEDESNLSVDSI